MHGCWQGIDSFRPDPENPDRVLFTTTGEREAHWDDVEGESFYCSACDTSRPRLEEMVTARPIFECRACGWRGSELEDHPDSCPETAERIDPLRPTPGQETLIPQNPGTPPE